MQGRNCSLICCRSKVGGWSKEQIAALALGEFRTLGSCLIIVNTKIWARQLYESLKPEVEESAVFHLSTNLCPAHRKSILALVRKRLNNDLPVLCVSTQLIEAGVDVDFASVIRFLAGLDSIAQAAGRCNRNGLRDTATVYVVNPDKETIDSLPDIKTGRDKALRVLGEGFSDLLAPDAIKKYFYYYFFDLDRAKDMVYPVTINQVNDNLLNLLSDNKNNVGKKPNPHLLKQSFMTVGKAFKAIDSPTQAVIVPYGTEGRDLIADLGRVAKEFDVKAYRKLLKKAQAYSVNVFPNVWRKLQTADAVHEIQPGEAIYYLVETYYSVEFGLSDTPCGFMSFADL